MCSTESCHMLTNPHLQLINNPPPLRIRLGLINKVWLPECGGTSYDERPSTPKSRFYKNVETL